MRTGSKAMSARVAGVCVLVSSLIAGCSWIPDRTLVYREAEVAERMPARCRQVLTSILDSFEPIDATDLSSASS